MKFSWGKGIFLLYTGFVLITLALVAFAMTKKVDLVTDNYYDKELKFEQHIKKQKNSEGLNKKPAIEQKGNSIKIIFPKEFNPGKITGMLKLYRPSDSEKDSSFAIKTDAKGEQEVSLERFLKGRWKLQIDWRYDNVEYYSEESVFLQ